MTLEILRYSIIGKKENIALNLTISGFSTVDEAKRFLQTEFAEAILKAQGQTQFRQESLP